MCAEVVNDAGVVMTSEAEADVTVEPLPSSCVRLDWKVTVDAI